MTPEEFPNYGSADTPKPPPESSDPWSLDEPTEGDTERSPTPDLPNTAPNPFNVENSSTGIPINLSWGTSNVQIRPPSEGSELEQRLTTLRQEEQQLQLEIASLKEVRDRMVRGQGDGLQEAFNQMMKDNLAEWEQRKQALQLAVEQLERRQERIKAEMRTTFAGTSQDVAVRVQGFKDYLVNSLQDLVTTVEELRLQVPKSPPPDARREDREGKSDYAGDRRSRSDDPNALPRFAEQAFEAQTRQIRQLLDQYRTSPDYYGAPWQLRRTFEPIHAERVSNWFFTQGGRGAIRTMGSRLQNILVASAVISILRSLYGDRMRVLVLSDLPERLGEWRRGLQDCLGITRGDFGSDQGVVLFEAPEPLAQRADRLMKQKLLPLIIIDESEDVVSLSILQFPFWLAFASDPMNPTSY
jgi:hypothetical protein